MSKLILWTIYFCLLTPGKANFRPCCSVVLIALYCSFPPCWDWAEAGEKTGILSSSLFPSVFLTHQLPVSQALRLSDGEQSDWVMSQTPIVWSHGLMLCQTPQPVAHATRSLSQQRNTPSTPAFCTFLCFFFSFKSPSLSIFPHQLVPFPPWQPHCLSSSLFSQVSLPFMYFPKLWCSLLCVLFLFFPSLPYLNVVTVHGKRCSSAVIPLFLPPLF